MEQIEDPGDVVIAVVSFRRCKLHALDGTTAAISGSRSMAASPWPEVV